MTEQQSEPMQDDRDNEYVEPREEPSIRMLRQMIVQNHASAESGHRRLRDDYRTLHLRFDGAEAAHAHTRRLVAELGEQMKRPIEVSTLRFTPQMVVAIAALCASIITGQYLSTSGLRSSQESLRSDIRDVVTKMDNLKQHDTDQIKLQDERFISMSQSINAVKLQLTEIEIRRRSQQP